MTEDEVPTLQTEMRGISHIQSFKQCYLLKLNAAPTTFHAMLHHPGETSKEILAINTICILTIKQSCGTTLHEETKNTCKRHVLNKQHACAHHLPTSSVHFWRQQLIEQSLLPQQHNSLPIFQLHKEIRITF